MSATQPADLLIEARWVLPIAPAHTALEHHSVVVTEGRIVAVGPTAVLENAFEPKERVVRADHALLPGLVNAHTHAATVLTRGRSPLRPAPGRTAFVSPDFVRDGTLIAIAEMLRAGITSFGDLNAFPEETARVAAAARMRAVIGLPLSETPTPWAESLTAGLAKAEHLWDEYKSDPWVCLYFAPESVNAMSDDTLTRLRTVGDELEARVALPLHENRAEISESLGSHGRRPLQRLDALGLLRPGFAAIHMNRLDEEDLDLVTSTGISVVACPQSNLRLGNGLSPIGRLRDRNVTVGLGSGSAVSAGALDILAEARAGSLTDGCSSEQALWMATLGGASALGLGSSIGSIEPGKAADLIAVDLSAPGTQTAFAPIESLIYSATRRQVSDVWIAGRAAVAAGRLLVFNEQDVNALIRKWNGTTGLDWTDA